MFVISCSGRKQHLWLTLISKHQSLILIAHNDALENFLNRGHLRGSQSKFHRSRLTQQCRDWICLPAEGAGWAGGLGIGGLLSDFRCNAQKAWVRTGKDGEKNRLLPGRELIKTAKIMQQKGSLNTKLTDYIIVTSFKTNFFDYFFFCTLTKWLV